MLVGKEKKIEKMIPRFKKDIDFEEKSEERV